MTGQNQDTVFQGHDETQIKLMEEMCILVDGSDKKIGQDTKKNTHLMTNINKGMLHRAFSVFLFDGKRRLLLQQRADEKITFPGYWTNTCCSHPLNKPDELEETNQMGARRAAVRKLEHELGIPQTEIPLNDLQFLTRIHYLAPSDGVWGEHEVDYIFIVQKDNVHLEPSPNEVQATRYVTQEELKDLFAQAEQGKVKITPWFRLIVETFLYKWWNDLDNLEAHKDDKVHKMV